MAEEELGRKTASSQERLDRTLGIKTERRMGYGKEWKGCKKGNRGEFLRGKSNYVPAAQPNRWEKKEIDRPTERLEMNCRGDEAAQKT